MKKTIPHLLSLLIFYGFMSACSGNVSAQTVIYNENFDATPFVLPAGWTATANSWTIDTSNSSIGYTGASGLQNVVVKNVSSAPGTDDLISKNISTVGYSNIKIIWGARFTTHFADSGSHINGIYWSSNGTTWNNIPYVENGNNSLWYLDNDSTIISLSAAAANQPMLQFKWSATILTSASGTYRIDDFKVSGTVSTSVDELTENSNSLANVYVLNNSQISIAATKPVDEKLQVEIYDISGKAVLQTEMNSSTLILNSADLTGGIYFVKVSNSTGNTVSKVFLK